MLSAVAECDAAPRPWLYPSLLACVSENRRFPLDGSGWIPALQCNTAHLLGDIGKHRFDITLSGKKPSLGPNLALKVGDLSQGEGGIESCPSPAPADNPARTNVRNQE